MESSFKEELIQKLLPDISIAREYDIRYREDIIIAYFTSLTHYSYGEKESEVSEEEIKRRLAEYFADKIINTY